MVRSADISCQMVCQNECVDRDIRGQTSLSRIAVGIALATALWVVPRPAVAEGECSVYRGVSVEQRERARKLHRAGNKHLAEAEFEAALAIYRSAIAEWDHPGLRFNMTIALVRMNHPVEAYENLLAALRCGPDPLGPESYAQALKYKTDLEKSVAELEVVCDEPDARVSLDGRLLFIGPGKLQLWVRTGEHLVVGQRPDRRTISESIVVEPRRLNHAVMARWPIETRRVLVSRWATWKPWLVTAAGAATVLAGVPLELSARSNLSAYEQAIAACGAKQCDYTESMKSLHERSMLQNRLAVGAFATGGVLLVTGLTLVILNRPRARTVPRLTVAPLVSEERALVTGTLRF